MCGSGLPQTTHNGRDSTLELSAKARKLALTVSEQALSVGLDTRQPVLVIQAVPYAHLKTRHCWLERDRKIGSATSS